MEDIIRGGRKKTSYGSKNSSDIEVIMQICQQVVPKIAVCQNESACTKDKLGRMNTSVYMNYAHDPTEVSEQSVSFSCLERHEISRKGFS